MIRSPKFNTNSLLIWILLTSLIFFDCHLWIVYRTGMSTQGKAVTMIQISNVSELKILQKTKIDRIYFLNYGWSLTNNSLCSCYEKSTLLRHSYETRYMPLVSINLGWNQSEDKKLTELLNKLLSENKIPQKPISPTGAGEFVAVINGRAYYLESVVSDVILFEKVKEAYEIEYLPNWITGYWLTKISVFAGLGVFIKGQFKRRESERKLAANRKP